MTFATYNHDAYCLFIVLPPRLAVFIYGGAGVCVVADLSTELPLVRI